MPYAPRSIGQQRRKEADKRRGTFRERGYTTAWTKLSTWYRSLPENVECACGCHKEPEMVDHIDAVTGPDDPMLLDIRNLQAMTHACHTKKSMRFDGYFGHAPDRSEQAAKDKQAMRDAAARRAEKIEARGGYVG